MTDEHVFKTTVLASDLATSSEGWRLVGSPQPVIEKISILWIDAAGERHSASLPVVPHQHEAGNGIHALALAALKLAERINALESALAKLEKPSPAP